MHQPKQMRPDKSGLITPRTSSHALPNYQIHTETAIMLDGSPGFALCATIHVFCYADMNIYIYLSILPTPYHEVTFTLAWGISPKASGWHLRIVKQIYRFRVMAFPKTYRALRRLPSNMPGGTWSYDRTRFQSPEKRASGPSWTQAARQ